MNELIPYFPLLGPAVAALVVILGWAVTHYLTVSRDIKSKQREMRIQFLLEAYRRLEGASNRLEPAKDERDKFESALADIQLLGTEIQIKGLMEFLDEWKLSQGNASINPLLELLRSHLRKELNLENNVPSIEIFRFTNRHPQK